MPGCFSPRAPARTAGPPLSGVTPATASHPGTDEATVVPAGAAVMDAAGAAYRLPPP
jgi:hypothetical protein